MKKETLLHSKKIQKMITQYKHDMQLVDQLTADAAPHYEIEQELYVKHEVKRGLRDLDGKGVRAGLTTISKVSATQMVDGREVPAPGQLLYRGIPIEELVQGFITHDRFGFEEIVYLLLMGHLPQEEQLRQFKGLLADYQELPNHFNSGVIMKMPSDNIMNTMAKCVLALHAYDPKPDDTSLPNVMRQCIQLVAQFPSLAVFGYQASMYFRNDKSMLIRNPDPNLSIAENILYMMRPDGKYTRLEAKLLDLCLVLHAEHGGGNNSAFTVHVVSSSGTDTYSTIAAALGSLKGPKHGRRKHQGHGKFEDLKKHCPDWTDEDALRAYLQGLLRGRGLRPQRSDLRHGSCGLLRLRPQSRNSEIHLWNSCLMKRAATTSTSSMRLWSVSPRKLSPRTGRSIKVSAPTWTSTAALFIGCWGCPWICLRPPSPARIAGWSAHRLEELINCRKIIRPAYLSVAEPQEYVPLEER